MSLFPLTFGMHLAMPVMWEYCQAALSGVKENFIYFLELEGILHIIELNDSPNLAVGRDHRGNF